MIEKQDVRMLDAGDLLAGMRNAFILPPETVYLDGNSLGPLPRGTAARLAEVVEEQWGQGLIRSWNSHGWFDMPMRVGDRLAGLIGARPGEVVVADSTSVNLMKLVSAALPLRPGRSVILSDTGNFPNDLYIVQGLIAALGTGHELRLVAPEDVADAIDTDVALLMLTEVDYRTGRRHDMASLSARAAGAGALTLWDLCHSAGALPVDLAGCGADLAVGCGYKYLNGGPGAPAFLYVAEHLQPEIRPVLSGWMGHTQPFAFDLDYRPAEGIARNLAGTPSILGLTALDASLDILLSADMDDIRAKSLALGDLFLALVDERLPGHGFEVITPRTHDQRGSQISLRHPQGYAIMQALIAERVIGDFRAPDILRFGLGPLYTSFDDIRHAVDVIDRVMATGSWQAHAGRRQAAVT